MNQSDLFNTYFIYKAGILYWKINPGGKVRAGDVAGNIDGKGYLRIRLKKKEYKVHRVIWQMFNGDLREIDQIDHIDRNPLNNNIGNLRKCDNLENSYNRSKNKNNSSGYKGVFFYKWDSRSKPWYAKITAEGKVKHLGYYHTAEAAAVAYSEAAKSLHKEFATL